MPNSVLGAAWKPQQERMDAGIYFPLYLVLVNGKNYSVFYLAADLQSKSMFIPRKPLSASAKRAGWRGFMYDISKIKNHFVRLKYMKILLGIVVLEMCVTMCGTCFNKMA